MIEGRLTHALRVLEAIRVMMQDDLGAPFSIRRLKSIPPATEIPPGSYGPTIKSLRVDPGTAPRVRGELAGSLIRCPGSGIYRLSPYGEKLLRGSKEHLAQRIAIIASIEQVVNYTRSATIDLSSIRGATFVRRSATAFRELERNGLLARLDKDRYVLLSRRIDVTDEDYPPNVLDGAIRSSNLMFPDVNVSERTALVRTRRGQQRLRQLTLENYGRRCAVCDITTPSLLRASHIVRWADDVDARGRLSNMVCLCYFHDKLFEDGFFTFEDSLQVRKRPVRSRGTVRELLDRITEFRAPTESPPDPTYLSRHRTRCRFYAEPR